MHYSRCLLWSLSLIGSCLAALLYLRSTPVFDAPGGLRVLSFILIGVFGFAMIFLAPRLPKGREVLCLLFLPALLLRFILLPAAPSDDVNRYVWEGQLVREGISPYAHTADAPEWEAYRTEYWEGMNHKDRRTAYPPMAQLLFALSTTADNPILGLKAWILAADLLTLAGIVFLLQRRGLPLLYAGFYAFNPVVLIAFAAEAHFDVFVVAALVGALWAYESGFKKWALFLAAVATGVKWVTLPLLPLFARFGYLRAALIIGAVLGLPALYFWETLPMLISGLFQFGSGSSFNGPVFSLLNGLLGLPRGLCLVLVVGLFAGLVLWRWLGASQYALDSSIRWILGALLLLSPTVHFWYLAWILPFVCLRPTMPWVFLSLSSGIYFMVWTRSAEGLGWGLSAGQQICFWGPFALALLYEFWSTGGRCAFARGRRIGSAPESVSLVIPTLNAEKHLAQALESIAGQTPSVEEVILVDGGSTDGTLAVAEAASLPVKVLACKAGRGAQIKKGIQSASAEWVLVLHADARLAPGSIATLLKAVKHTPGVIGGAFGQRFAGAHPELIPIELLNDLRALFSRTSFGDQVQFFHRSSALALRLMPNQALMEDVESSWRVRESGEFLFLGYPSEVCHRSWRATQWLQRFALVMRLVSRYRVARCRSRRQALRLSRKLYQDYYGGPLPASRQSYRCL